MIKRAEEAALKAYPEKLEWDYRDMDYDPNMRSRIIFRQGYEQAEKDTIERAITWLIDHVDDYIGDLEVSRYKPPKLHVGGACWDDLKRFMEEE